MNYYLGVDVGSFETKAVLVDQNGVIVRTASAPHIMETPKPGYAEHDAEEVWWKDFCSVTREILIKTGINPGDIRCVGCSAIAPCCLPIDQNGKPLRKAILYGVDTRAKEQINALNEKMGIDYILDKYGNPITSQSIGPKILWVKENEPEIYEKTAMFVTSTTYLVAKLTGSYCIDHYTAAYFTPMYDLDACDWDYAGLDTFCKPEQLAKCMWTDDIAGSITSKAAQETGLAEGTPVIVGTADASADGVGAGVFHPGDMLMMFGSSVFMINIVPELKKDKRYWAGPYLFRDTYMVASGMSTSGTLTRWFRDELAPDMVRRQQEEGHNAYDLLMEEIDHIPWGSDGLIVLPHFSGERTPMNDPDAKGVFFGLTLNHTRAHLYQACLEGVAYGIGQHMQGYREIGIPIHRIVAVGGGTKTPKWMQIVANVTGEDLTIGSVFGAAFGDALLAAKAVGDLANIPAMEQWVQYHGTVHSQPEATEQYSDYLERYQLLYQQTKDLMHR